MLRISIAENLIELLRLSRNSNKQSLLGVGKSHSIVASSAGVFRRRRCDSFAYIARYLKTCRITLNKLLCLKIHDIFHVFPSNCILKDQQWREI